MYNATTMAEIVNLRVVIITLTSSNKKSMAKLPC
jgi:hypothetical protein